MRVMHATKLLVSECRKSETETQLLNYSLNYRIKVNKHIHFCNAASKNISRCY